MVKIRNIIKAEDKKIIWYGLFLIAIVVCMVMFWNLKVSGFARPIQHRVNQFTGEFKVTLGEIREITIELSEREMPVDLEITVYDKEGNQCWEGKYENLTIIGGIQTVELFEKDTPLLLEPGYYNADIILDGEQNLNIRCRFLEYNDSYDKTYFTLCTMIIVALIIYGVISNIFKMPLEWAYFITVLTLGIIFNFVLPPFSVPDELTHFAKAYRVSSAILFEEIHDEEGKMYIRQQDAIVQEYLHDAASIAEWQEDFGDKGNSEIISVKWPNISNRTVLSYIPSGIGIAIARLLNCSASMLLIAGRMMNSLAGAILGSIAIRLIPFCKKYLFVLGTVPEVIYLYASYSYDGINFALCMLIVAYFLYLYYRKDVIGLKDISIFIVLIAIMMPIKIVYFTFGALLLFLPKSKIKLSKKDIIFIIGLICICAGLVGGVSISEVFTKVNIESTADMSGTEEPLFTLDYALQEKRYSIMVFLNTIFGQSSEWFNKIFGESIIQGRYKFNDCYVISPILNMVVIILMLIGLEDSHKNTLSKCKKILVTGLGLISYIGVVASMFFVFTPIGSRKILGIQSRYFLPILILLPLIYRNNFYTIDEEKKEVCVIGMQIVNLAFIFMTFYHYISRYFM